MQSRMDKYNSVSTTKSSRTKKNQDLYETVKKSSLTNFDVNSNIAVIDDNADHIDVTKVRQMINERYSDDAPKRKSITLQTIEEPIIEESLVDTKEYDINAILAKAKQGKNVDYNKERLKRVRDAQFEILNNLDLELKKVEETKIKPSSEAESNLMNLINTITELELKNRENAVSKEASQALDLLSDLSDSDEEIEDPIEPQEEVKIIPEEDSTSKQKIISLEETTTQEEIEDNEEDTTSIEKTLSRLEIKQSDYDDFSDVSMTDKGSIIIKIFIFILVVALVAGAVYILNSALDLGLF